ncbi:MAG TPA: CobW family GTP-binding protein [Pseudolysinimonas sp.]|nr:CobW family GTP-binding protein [Pseudolysinimonas sp.]
MTSAPIPIHLVVGFLGAGKTTLLSELLDRGRLDETLLIINELGAAGVDQEVLRGRGGEVPVLLAGGCICCSTEAELGHTLRDIVARRESGSIPPFRRVVVETTGVADPGPLLRDLATDSWLLSRFRLGSVTTLVDVSTALEALDDQPEAIQQVVHADRLVLSKLDLVDTERRAAVIARLSGLADSRRIIDREVALDDPGFFDESELRRTAPAPLATPATGHALEVFELDVSSEVSWRSLSAALDELMGRYGTWLLRLKGIVRVSDVDHPIAVHGVRGSFFPPVVLPSVSAPAGIGKLTVIARHGLPGEAVTGWLS